MGFSRTEPCIMLRLTRMFGWYPNDFEISESAVTFQLLPKDGMSTCAFPFWNKPGYQQPFVMLKLSNITDGKLISRIKIAGARRLIGQSYAHKIWGVLQV
ncbi:hypothetical protein ANCCAN_18690 [Ancylostoma caninum]|uniref:Uncharacterized protein n=1 Tax=Ancylostoma caninum TaxID=29170 RepID=A0A368FT87_ANCCA|nr:hypothetical protein ANCCAN_18690 [Ancylostoma caninum]